MADSDLNIPPGWIHTEVTTGHRMPDQMGSDKTTWVKATIYLNMSPVASGWAPERPPYVEGTARSSAISMAQIMFGLNVLGKNIKDSPGAEFKSVKGVA